MMSFACELRAGSQLRPDPIHPGGFESLGNDPHFEIVIPARKSHALVGWVLLSCDIELPRSWRAQKPHIYVDYGDGMSESTRQVLDFFGSGSRKTCLIRFPSRAVALRLDPAESIGRFRLGRLTLRPVPLPWALWWTFRRSIALYGWKHAMQAASNVARPFLGSLFGGKGATSVGAVEAAVATANSPTSRHGYAAWVDAYDTIDADSRAELEAGMADLERRPTISILVPAYNTPEQWLVRCIDSVREQIYPHWQLCIANDASTAPHVKQVLDRYAALDERIAVVHRSENGHISASSNSALAIARGEFVALLDHDDELPQDALLEVVRALQDCRDARLLYSDEDKIDEQGNRFDPYFKPSWNPELLLGQNFISHLGVYCASLVREVGGFRLGYEGSQDWDLALRCVERLAPRQIVHIPRILYHWRAIEGSTARSNTEKSYAARAGYRAVESYLERAGIAADIELTSYSFLRVRRRAPNASPLVSLIIPTRDRVDLLRQCVDSILRVTRYARYEILVVDNDSVEEATHAYLAQIGRLPQVRVLPHPGPFNFSTINNHAVAQAAGEIVGLINNDIEVISPDWLDEMLSHAVRPDVGAVGAMLYYPNDTIQHAGVIVGFHGVAAHAHTARRRGDPGYLGRAMLTQELSAVTAACLLVRKAVYEQVGGLDEQLGVAFNDVDFCLKVQAAGYRNVWTPLAELYHHESASRGLEDNPEKLGRFHREIDGMLKRWGTTLQFDPFYNPNLSLQGEPFTPGFPPRWDPERPGQRRMQVRRGR